MLVPWRPRCLRWHVGDPRRNGPGNGALGGLRHRHFGIGYNSPGLITEMRKAWRRRMRRTRRIILWRKPLDGKPFPCSQRCPPNNCSFSFPRASRCMCCRVRLWPDPAVQLDRDRPRAQRWATLDQKPQASCPLYEVQYLPSRAGLVLLRMGTSADAPVWGG